ncbi:unnamed protein product, partial [Owenia fusiformis]
MATMGMYFLLLVAVCVVSLTEAQDCLSFINYEYRNSDPTQFTWKTTPCTSAAQIICEIPKAAPECPPRFNVNILNTCYYVNLTRVPHVDIDDLCATRGGRRFYVNTAEEANLMGEELRKYPDTAAGFKEFSIRGWEGKGEYTNEQADGTCLIITNYRNKNSDPGIFYNTTEDCTGGSQRLCEASKLDNGECPAEIDDFYIENTCYDVDFAFNSHDKNSVLCNMAGGHLVDINSREELAAVGNKLVELGIQGQGTIEFSVKSFSEASSSTINVAGPLDATSFEVNFDENGECLLFTNMRNAATDRTKFIWIYQACTNNAMTLCEMQKPLTGCPSDFDDIITEDSCYKYNQAFVLPASIIPWCNIYGGTIASIDNASEAATLGVELTNLPDNGYKELFISGWTG